MSEDSGLRMGKSPVSRSLGWGGAQLGVRSIPRTFSICGFAEAGDIRAFVVEGRFTRKVFALCVRVMEELDSAQRLRLMRLPAQALC
jgi:hypothetical protein